MFSFNAAAKLRFFTAAALLVMPLLLAGQAVAAPATDNRPVAKNTRSAIAKSTATPATPAAQASKPAALPVAAVEPATSAAPQTVQIKGIVLAPDGRPCAGASVYPAGAPRQLVVTDAQGAFTLPVPAGGAASLRVEYFGEGSSRVEVPAPGTALVRVTLGQ
jgi:hypothetical protein